MELDPEAPGVLDTGLEELASLIDVLSRFFVSVITSTPFDFILAEAEAESGNGGVMQVYPVSHVGHMALRMGKNK